jgi:hypothetical protein
LRRDAGNQAVWSASSWQFLAEGSLKQCRKVRERDSERLAEDSKLNHIDSPFAAFALAHEGLRLANLAGKVGLR